MVDRLEAVSKYLVSPDTEKTRRNLFSMSRLVTQIRMEKKK